MRKVFNKSGRSEKLYAIILSPGPAPSRRRMKSFNKSRRPEKPYALIMSPGQRREGGRIKSFNKVRWPEKPYAIIISPGPAPRRGHRNCSICPDGPRKFMQKKVYGKVLAGRGLAPRGADARPGPGPPSARLQKVYGKEGLWKGSRWPSGINFIEKVVPVRL